MPNRGFHQDWAAHMLESFFIYCFVQQRGYPVQVLTLTWSIHLDALVRLLRTVAVVAVAQASVTREAVDSEDVLRTGGALPVTVLFQVALVPLLAALLGPRRDLCTRKMSNTSWLGHAPLPCRFCSWCPRRRHTTYRNFFSTEAENAATRAVRGKKSHQEPRRGQVELR